MIKRLFLSLVFVCVAICTFAANEVSWTIRLEGDNTDSPKVVMTATIAPGFHLYAPENPAGGSQPLEFYITPKGCKLDGKPVANKKYTKEYDDVFEGSKYKASLAFSDPVPANGERTYEFAFAVPKGEVDGVKLKLSLNEDLGNGTDFEFYKK